MGNNDKINSIVENLRKLYQQEYGIAVFNIDVKNFKSGVEIKGSALTENQRDHIINAFSEKKIKIRKENLKILSDAHARNEIGWVVVKSPIADLKLRFVSGKIINQRILKRIRCSQAFKGEILRVLYKNEDQLLVQQNDLTLGWVNRKDVVLKKKSLYRKWMSGNFAIKGKAVFAKKFHINTPPAPLKRGIGTVESTNKITEEAEEYLGAKYVLGGKSKKGIDCSGLVQVAYKNSLNIILPKHSWDQKKMGKKVKLEDVKTGDLMFLIKKENSHKHVGIVEKNKDINLIHASLEKKKVIKQSLEKVFESYDFVEIRRIVK
jgi:probable lipoprotein NlpC